MPGMDWVNFVMSTLTGIFTLYFWLVRANKERPKLSIYQIKPLDAQFLASGPNAPPDTMRSQFFLSVAVANDSTSPNALLGLRAMVKLNNGEWSEAKVSIDDKTPVPCNVTPMQTVSISFSATVIVPDRPESAPRVSQRQAAIESVADPVQVVVELRSLGEKRFSQKLVYLTEKAPALRAAA